MYPGSDYFPKYYSRLTVHYLRSLKLILDESVSETFRSAAKAGLEMAERATLAYGGAVMLLAGEMADGIRLGNAVMNYFDDGGAHYSTVDSAAALALLMALRNAGVRPGHGKVVVNGERLSSQDAAETNADIETIKVAQGVALVEVTRLAETDWASFGSPFKVKANFSRKGLWPRKPCAGEMVELNVHLSQGYENGDLLHVDLPPCLAYLERRREDTAIQHGFCDQRQVVHPVTHDRHAER
ncbi:MAG: hypothetical protein HOI95_28195 [Chromatiales bacterium]|jgi:hypothetical protein|nr:hypothetical protein [Chromatiales bacterium]